MKTSRGSLRPMTGLVAAGIAVLLIGIATGPDRLWPNLFLVSFMGLGFGLGSLLFIAFHHVTGAAWSERLLPPAAAVARTVPATALLTGAIVLANLPNYPWMHAERTHRATFWFKEGWLQPAFFAARTAVYVLVWTGFAVAMTPSGRRQAASDRAARRQRQVRLSATFLVVFSVTFWLAATDWVMSLEPEWYSTIFGVYHFAGVFLAGLAAIALLAVVRTRFETGEQPAPADTLHDLGKLLFAFSSFWMYIWFSQFMLIWYTNIPEETGYYAIRTQGIWQPLFLLNVCLNWAIPFVVLLPRAAKRNATVLVRVSLVLLAGRWLDLYLMILPATAGGTPRFGFSEAGSLAAAAGMFAMLLGCAVRRSPGACPNTLS